MTRAERVVATTKAERSGALVAIFEAETQLRAVLAEAKIRRVNIMQKFFSTKLITRLVYVDHYL